MKRYLLFNILSFMIMKKSLNCFLVVCLSFFLCQCDNNSDALVNQTDNTKNEEVAVTSSDFAVVAEHRQAREEADKLTFSFSDFLQTKEPMSDDAIAPFNYKTGLVGDKAYNIKVYVTALERVKRNLTVKDNQLIMKAKSGRELSMSEDLYLYISELLCTWNSLVKEGRFDIINIGNDYYDIEPNIQDMKPARANPVDIYNMRTHNERWDAVKSVVDSEPVGTYVGEHFVFNFGGNISGEFSVSGKIRRYYVCDGCSTHGVSDPTCSYNYIATSVTVPDSQMTIRSLRNVSQLAVITYQQGK